VSRIWATDCHLIKLFIIWPSIIQWIAQNTGAWSPLQSMWAEQEPIKLSLHVPSISPTPDHGPLFRSPFPLFRKSRSHRSVTTLSFVLRLRPFSAPLQSHVPSGNDKCAAVNSLCIDGFHFSASTNEVPDYRYRIFDSALSSGVISHRRPQGSKEVKRARKGPNDEKLITHWTVG
jgi:hypothetical protein